MKTGSKWSDPVLLAADIYEFKAATDGTDICVTWTYYDRTTYFYPVVARTYSGGAWGAETVLANDNNYRSTLVLGGGPSDHDFCVAWLGYSVSKYRLWVTTRNASTGIWDGAAPIDNNAVPGDVSNPVIQAGDNGYGLIFTHNARKYATVYDSGAWNTTQIIDNGASFNDATIASSGTMYLVAWRENLGPNNAILCTVYDATGDSWSAPQNLNAVSGNNAYSPSAAGNSTGFLLMWDEYTGSYEAGYSRLITDVDVGDPEEAGLTPGNITTMSSYGPRVSTNGTGFASAFTQFDEYGIYSLHGNVWDGTWGTPSLLETGIDIIDYYDYIIVSDGSGYGAVWKQMDAKSRVNLYLSRYDGEKWKWNDLSNARSSISTFKAAGSDSSTPPSGARRTLRTNWWITSGFRNFKHGADIQCNRPMKA